MVFGLVFIIAAILRFTAVSMLLSTIGSIGLFWLSWNDRTEKVREKLSYLRSDEFSLDDLEALEFEEVQSLLQWAIDHRESERAEQISVYLLSRVDRPIPHID